MNKKQIIGLIVAVALFIVTGVTSVLTNTISEKMVGDSTKQIEELLAGDVSFSAPSNPYIAVVEVKGTIQEQVETDMFTTMTDQYQHTTTMEYIDQLIDDENNKGILLYVDSPGGTVYESEELYLKLLQYKEETGYPVWAYMSHYAASGGYMISMAADKIYANSNTTTGSIGVIMSGYDMTGLYEKLGIEYVSITSGDNKDSSQMNEEQIEIYQSQVDECYERFVDIVEDGRDMSENAVKKLADGRTYTAKQALSHGLIDEIALYDDMKNEMMEELGVHDLYELETSDNVFASLFANVKNLVPKSEAQILKETAAEMESGVLMYYAEPF